MKLNAETLAKIRESKQERGIKMLEVLKDFHVEILKLQCEKKKIVDLFWPEVMAIDKEIQTIEEKCDCMFREISGEAMATTLLGSPLSFWELVNKIQIEYSCNRAEAITKLYDKVFHPPQAPIGRTCQRCGQERAIAKILKTGVAVCKACLPKTLASL